jgi:plasmid stability protein
MQFAGLYAERMKTLQVRNGPDDVHRRLKVRAAEQGRSLSELVLEELRRSLERPTRQDLLDRIAAREPFEVDSAAAVRAERDAR